MNNKDEYSNFIQDIIDHDMKNNIYGKVHTRFPPEPNGCLHIGHAKAICIDYGIAERNNGLYNLRFDDTNPVKEDTQYVEAIKEDVKWLGFDWEDRLYYASDYFDKLYEYAVKLVELGKAYVCDLSPDEIRNYRGTLTEPGKNSPFRNRPVKENLELFTRMKNGEFEDGSRVLRAKINMSSPNMNMRDPVIYRIQHSTHHRTGDKWCIYPMYDYAHPLSDAIENISHSMCSLEFEDHRPLYDWFLKELGIPGPPRQIEFARLNLTYTVMSKRKLLLLVEDKYVSGWDDPRMPTLCGLRRKGYTSKSIRAFCDKIGIAKTYSKVDISFLEHCIREDLNKKAHRIMAVQNPVKVVIDNYPEGKVEEFEVENNPEDPGAGNRLVPFSRELYIEQNDFMEDPPRKFFRLAPGREVRLKSAYFITCTHIIKNEKGEINEIHCTYDPETRGGNAPDGRKVKGTIHWVSARHALDAEIRLYENLFSKEDPYDAEEGGSFLDNINSDSLRILVNCKIEPNAKDAEPGTSYQFMRLGYYCVDKESGFNKLVFNRTVTLRDTWAKIAKK